MCKVEGREGGPGKTGLATSENGPTRNMVEDGQATVDRYQVVMENNCGGIINGGPTT